MKSSFAALSFVLAAVLLPVSGASSEAASSNKQAEQEEQSPAISTQQNLRRRANVFNNSNNSNSNSASNVDLIVVLHNDGRRRKLNGIGQATADERKAAAEENKAAAAATAGSMGLAAKLTFGTALHAFVANVHLDQIKSIEEDSRVAYVEMDSVVQLDPMEMGEDRRRLAPPAGKGPNGGGDDSGGDTQKTPWGITRVNGGSGRAAYNDATAWVIDSGIDLDHPDLNVDTGRSASFTRDDTPNDTNGHGMYDLLMNKYFCCYSDDVLTSIFESVLIGTHVAGTIGAYDNEFGVVGVVPGAPVVAVR